MNGHVSLYKDKLGKSWIVDLGNGTRENPGRNREGFASWLNAYRAAQVYTDSWRIQYPGETQAINTERAGHARQRIEMHRVFAGATA